MAQEDPELKNWLFKYKIKDSQVHQLLKKNKITLPVLLESTPDDIRELCKENKFTAVTQVKLVAARNLHHQMHSPVSKSSKHTESRTTSKKNKKLNSSTKKSTLIPIQFEPEQEQEERLRQQRQEEEDLEAALQLQIQEQQRHQQESVEQQAYEQQLIQQETQQDDAADLDYVRQIQAEEERIDAHAEIFGRVVRQMLSRGLGLGAVDGGVFGFNPPFEMIEEENHDSNLPHDHIISLPGRRVTPEQFRAFQKNDISCRICLEPFDESSVVKTIYRCGCPFHEDCINRWVGERKINNPRKPLECPVDRSTLLEL